MSDIVGQNVFPNSMNFLVANGVGLKFFYQLSKYSLSSAVVYICDSGATSTLVSGNTRVG